MPLESNEPEVFLLPTMVVSNTVNHAKQVFLFPLYDPFKQISTLSVELHRTHSRFGLLFFYHIPKIYRRSPCLKWSILRLEVRHTRFASFPQCWKTNQSSQHVHNFPCHLSAGWQLSNTTKKRLELQKMCFFSGFCQRRKIYPSFFS